MGPEIGYNTSLLTEKTKYASKDGITNSSYIGENFSLNVRLKAYYSKAT